MSSTFYSAKNFVHGMYKSTLEYVTPVSETSEFTEKGVLTPDEFIKAGNQLVYRCPTWQWEGGHPKKRWSFLPDKQQFLSTKGVPCAQRVRALMGCGDDETLIEDGEWLATGESSAKKGLKSADTASVGDADSIGDSADEIGDMDEEDEALEEITGRMDDTSLFTETSDAADAAGDADADDGGESELKTAEDDPGCESDSDSFEEIPEMDEFDDTDNLVIETGIPGDGGSGSSAASSSASGKSKKSGRSTNDDLFVKTRTYDLSIAFDKHYQVPRLWLRGYDENNRPLTSKQIMEDISADHAHKTVTVESHPHLKGVVCASIHPCRHSLVMKRFMSVFESQGKEITVEDYMFIFLKFMSGVIPTVDYDYTQTVGL